MILSDALNECGERGGKDFFTIRPTPPTLPSLPTPPTLPTLPTPLVTSLNPTPCSLILLKWL